MMRLIRMVVFVGKDRGEAGFAVASQFNSARKKVMGRNDCIDDDNNSEDPANFAAVRILIVRVARGDMGAYDPSFGLIAVLNDIRRCTECRFIGSVTDRNGGAVTDCCGDDGAVGWTRD
jgi:hypothetical protein